MESHTDADTGKQYYFHKQSGSTMWHDDYHKESNNVATEHFEPFNSEMDVRSRKISSADLRAESQGLGKKLMTIRLDEDYWYNASTGETQWASDHSHAGTSVGTTQGEAENGFGKAEGYSRRRFRLAP